MTSTPNPTAALLVIGDEILSGRTRDKNIGVLADFCTETGLDLREIRVVADDMDAIIAALNALRAGYAYVFTSGGIGPTHDDITADAVARAFGVDLPVDDRALKAITSRYVNFEMTPARLRMARIPVGGDLIENPVSAAPGIHIGNVFVLAGVPVIFEAMLNSLAGRLATGVKLGTETVDCWVGEGTIGDELGIIQQTYPTVKIGSYPQFGGPGPMTQLVLRSADMGALAEAAIAVRAMVDRVHREKDITPAKRAK